jgi:hypothetical protein
MNHSVKLPPLLQGAVVVVPVAYPVALFLGHTMSMLQHLLTSSMGFVQQRQAS